MSSGSTVAIAHLAEAIFFGGVPDDILVNILCRLDEDPRDLARLACVSTRFCKLIKTVCWKFTCEKILPLLVTELLQSASPALGPFPEPPGGWGSLQKLLVCCPGLWHAGVLLENWDFGLDRWCSDYGCPAGFSYSDGSVALEGAQGVLRLGAFSSNPSASGSACMSVNNVDRHVCRDVCELDVSYPSTQCAYAGMDSDCRKEGKSSMDTHGKEVGMDKGECSKKAFVKDMGYNENSMESCRTGRGRQNDNDKELLDSMNVEVGAKQCGRIQNALSDSVEGLVEECCVRDQTNRASSVGCLDDEALPVDGAMAGIVQKTVQMVNSTVMHSCPIVLNSDSLIATSAETGCRYQNEAGSDTAGTLAQQMDTTGSFMSPLERGMHGRRSKSRHKRQRKCHYERCHATTGPWNLSREQGNKLLANRFRADSLYICDWPGCLHPGNKRTYKLFRGVFKNFKHSHVWRNLKDMQAKATDVGCAFCVCKSTWDMVTTFCLKRSIEYHDDGEPVVRAYVCENGHVAGAWTDRPMYIF